MKGLSRTARRGLYGQRRSKSHVGFLRREFERIGAMSARERMVEALRLDEEIRSLLKPPRRREVK